MLRDLEPGRVRGLSRTTPRSRSVVPRPRPGRQGAARRRPPVDRPSQFGKWIADIERPAEQYRGRYAAAARRGARTDREGQGERAGAVGAAAPPPRRARSAGRRRHGGARRHPRRRRRRWRPRIRSCRPRRRAAAADAPAGGDEGVAGSDSFMSPSRPRGRRRRWRRTRRRCRAWSTRPPRRRARPAAPAAARGGGAASVARASSACARQGTNTGAKVDEFLAAAGVSAGNPWCASFVTWSLERPATRWRAAAGPRSRRGSAPPRRARTTSRSSAPRTPAPATSSPTTGASQDDFAADGHIGFLASEVKGGKFTALEGNNQDAVMRVPRHSAWRTSSSSASAATRPPGSGRRAGSDARRRRRRRRGLGRRGLGGGGTLPGRQRAQGADRRLARPRGREARAPEQLPVMASLVESGVKNLNYGDADSVGFFQMRVGIWNKGEYAGFPEKPELQASGSSTRPRRSRSSASRAGSRSPTRSSSASGSPTSSAPPSSTAAATRSASARPTACSAAPGPRRRRPSSRPPPPAGTCGVRCGRRRRGRGRGRRWRRRRPEGAGRAQGGGEVHRHQVQVGRLDAADRLRLLRPRAVGLRQGGHPDPARHRRPVLRLERHAGRPRRPAPGRPRLLRRAGQHLPRRDLDGRGQVPARAEDRRRGQGREPEGVLLLLQLRRRAALRHQRAGRRRRCRRRACRAAVAAAAPAIDPKAVAEAQAAVARDAAEVNRQGSGLFMAIKSQEERRHQTVQFMQAVDPKAAKSADAPQAAAAAAPAAAEPAAAAPAAAPRRGGPGRRRRHGLAAPTPASRSSCPTTSPTTTRATTRRRTRSRSGSPSRPTSTGCRPSCRSWPRWSSPA